MRLNLFLALWAACWCVGCPSSANNALPCVADDDCSDGHTCNLASRVCVVPDTDTGPGDGGSDSSTGLDGTSNDGSNTDGSSVSDGSNADGSPTSDGSTLDATGSDATSREDGVVSCPEDPTPTPSSTGCPETCNGGCAEGVCTINCESTRCEDTEVVCPSTHACRIVCAGEDACDGSEIVCPELYACELRCREGQDACGDIRLHCGEGSCGIDCAADTCDGAEVGCDRGQCSASCEGSPTPTLHCGDACGCAPC